MSNSSLFHLLYWSSAYFCWLFSTTTSHPNWTLRILCTGVLVTASAVYACRFTPQKLELKNVTFSVVMLMLCGTLAALLIHVLYDALLGPDPRRFSLTSNVIMDITFVLVNTLIAATVATMLFFTTGISMWRCKNIGTTDEPEFLSSMTIENGV